jgi:hypothetical protein
VNNKNVDENLSLVGLKLQQLLLVINSHSKKTIGSRRILNDMFDVRHTYSFLIINS